MIAFKVSPAVFINTEHKGHTANVAALNGRIKTARVAIVLRVKVYTNSHTLCIDCQLHRRIRVVITRTCKRYHSCIVVNQKAHVFQVCAVQCAALDYFVKVPQVCFGLVDNRAAVNDADFVFVLFCSDVERIEPLLV